MFIYMKIKHYTLKYIGIYTYKLFKYNVIH